MRTKWSYSLLVVIFVIYMLWDLYDLIYLNKQLTGTQAYVKMLILISFYHNFKNK